MRTRSDFRVLYVEDTEAQRYAVSRALRRAGFLVIEATCAEEALRLMQEKPDLVILDVKLPDMNGFEVCRRIKASPDTASIPVMHLSATFISANSQVEGLEGGADAYLTHPVEMSLLISTARALVRTREVWQKEKSRVRPAVVLSIDPDVGAARIRRLVLESQGYFVLNASGSPEAYALLNNQTVDLILLDADVPGAPARDIISELRRIRPQLPIVLFSSTYPGAEGADAALMKADGPEALLRSVRDLLRRGANATGDRK